MIILMYLFSLISYYWFYESYPEGDYCDSTFTCLLTSFDRSFKYDGAIGGDGFMKTPE
jgi:hypothetical protein